MDEIFKKFYETLLRDIRRIVREERTLIVKNSKPKELWLTKREAAKYLGMKPDTLAKKAKKGDIKYSQPENSRSMWFKEEWLKAYIKSGIKKTTEEKLREFDDRLLKRLER